MAITTSSSIKVKAILPLGCSGFITAKLILPLAGRKAGLRPTRPIIWGESVGAGLCSGSVP